MNGDQYQKDVLSTLARAFTAIIASNIVYKENDAKIVDDCHEVILEVLATIGWLELSAMADGIDFCKEQRP